MRSGFSKAFLLAAGLGKRLRPLTDQVPKCLVPVEGKPLLSIWLELCASLGIREVLINTHHLAEQVHRWAHTQQGGVGIHLVHEPELLGSAGTVARNWDFVEGEESFFIFYADNLVHADLDRLKAFHRRHPGLLTVGLFRSPNPRACGVVTLDESGCVTSFEEKPPQPRSDLANAGIYIARQALRQFLPARGFADFGKDIFPGLVGKMWGAVLEGYLLDVGTPENYRKAQQEWSIVDRTPRPQIAGSKSTSVRVQSE